MFYRCRCNVRSLPPPDGSETSPMPRAAASRKRARRFHSHPPEFPGALIVVIHGEEAPLGWMVLVPAE
jgi:hypothetical protein